MKLLTRDTDYAVRAVVSIARHRDGVVSAVDLVRELKIPRPFLRKILQALTRRGILRSRKGIGGGFELNRNPVAITLVDIMEIFQAPLSLNECLFRKKACPHRKTCALRKKIGKIERGVLSDLRSVVMGDLV